MRERDGDYAPYLLNRSSSMRHAWATCRLGAHAAGPLTTTHPFLALVTATHTPCRPLSITTALAGPCRDLATVDGGLELQQVARAKDGTRKLVFKLTCGEGAGGTVETVLIPVVREQGKKPRITVCVSSQVGCAMNCQFCYTGRMGLMGNLSTAQIVEQVGAEGACASTCVWGGGGGLLRAAAGGAVALVRRCCGGSVACSVQRACMWVW